MALFEYAGAKHWFDNADLAGRQLPFDFVTFNNCNPAEVTRAGSVHLPMIFPIIFSGKGQIDLTGERHRPALGIHDEWAP